MPPRGFKPAALALICTLGSATPSHPAPPTPWKPPGAPRPPAAPAESAAAPRAAKRPMRWIDSQPDTGQFLPDTVLLARVGDREIRVGDYIDAYFRSYAEFRPRPDSAGRVEFLNNVIDKEVLGLVALKINRPFGFEDRIAMRSHRQRELADVLFQRSVLDSVTVSEDEMRQIYEQFRYAVHLRQIRFDDRATAERARRDVVSGRIAWRDAVRMYSVAPDSDRARGGDLGWHTRPSFDPVLAPQVRHFVLRPGRQVAVPRGDGARQVATVFGHARPAADRRRFPGPRCEDFAEQPIGLLQAPLPAPGLRQDQEKVRARGRGDPAQGLLQQGRGPLVVVCRSQDLRLPRVCLVARRIDRQRDLVLRQRPRRVARAAQRVGQQDADLVGPRRQVARLAVRIDRQPHMPVAPRLVPALHQLLHTRRPSASHSGGRIGSGRPGEHRPGHGERSEQERGTGEQAAGRKGRSELEEINHGGPKVRWEAAPVNAGRPHRPHLQGRWAGRPAASGDPPLRAARRFRRRVRCG